MQAIEKATSQESNSHSASHRGGKTPVSHFRTPLVPSSKLGNEIDLYRILRGEEDRTTVMLRNIPNKFRQKTLLEMINKDYQGFYDYFYLPMDLRVSSHFNFKALF